MLTCYIVYLPLLFFFFLLCCSNSKIYYCKIYNNNTKYYIIQSNIFSIFKPSKAVIYFIYFVFSFVFLIVYMIFFDFEIIYCAGPALERARDVILEDIEYAQNQILNYQEIINQCGLNKPEFELTPTQITDKRNILQEKLEWEQNRRDFMRELASRDNAEALRQPTVQKRANDNYGEGPSKR